MDPSEARLVSRSEIARLAGVERPAIANWERRHDDFPRPVRQDGTELFHADQVATWLDGRKVPADARRAGEVKGTTYGERLRRGLGGAEPKPDIFSGMRTFVDSATDSLASLRGSVSVADHLNAILTLVHLHGVDRSAWSNLVRGVRSNDTTSVRAAFGDAPGRNLLSNVNAEVVVELVQLLDRALPDNATRDKRQRARVAARLFDTVLARYTEIERRRADDIHTPPTVGRLMVGVLAPSPAARRLYDPFCRSGDLLALLVEAVAAGSGDTSSLAAFGDTPSADSLRTAEMSLSLRGAGTRLRSTYAIADPPDGRGSFDVIATNPPFNVRMPSATMIDYRWWPYGAPPEHNANFAWLQLAVTSLASGGAAAVLMANGAASSANTRERSIRAGMVKDGAVECIVALPPRLFSAAGVPAMLWILRHPRANGGDVLFIDCREFGEMTSRSRRVLTDGDIEAVVRLCTSWRNGEPEAPPADSALLWASAAPLDIRSRDYSLNPAEYVSTTMARSDVAADIRVVAHLRAELARLQHRSHVVDEKVESLLEAWGTWT